MLGQNTHEKGRRHQEMKKLKGIPAHWKKEEVLILDYRYVHSPNHRFGSNKT